ncbi:LysR family transcriptional regulator [Vibrio sp. TRT 17S01]|uniref:LysR family transcriptional regulator n=1 Tax=Vibrio sp. TRT 17S01 TaxID=3418505 RepID=UPI003CED4049
MENMKRYCIFSVVAETGSMTAASKRLGMSPSAISQNIAHLEKKLGVTLLYRSTRGFSLSEAGRILLQGYENMREHFSELEDRLSECKSCVKGEVRIACSSGIGQETVARILAELNEDYPELNYTIFVGDEFHDLVGENIDIAVRIGDLKDSGLVFRPLGQIKVVLCASPHYLATKGTPESLSDLNQHDWILNSECDIGTRVNQMSEVAAAKVVLTPKIVSSSAMVSRTFAIEGHGLAFLPEEFIAPNVHRGELVTLLDDIQWPLLKIQALTVSRVLPKKVEVILDALKIHYLQHANK